MAYLIYDGMFRFVGSEGVARSRVVELSDT
jgi:hypothetical protein